MSDLKKIFSNLKSVRDFSSANERMEGGYTPLMVESYEGNLDAMRSLLEHGANVNDQSDGLNSAIDFAVMGGHVNAIRLLIENGADVTMTGHDGLTPLLLSIDRNEVEAFNEHWLEIFNIILTHPSYDVGSDACSYFLEHKMEGGVNALIASVSVNKFGMAKSLIERGVNVNSVDENGVSPIMLAAHNSNHAMFEMLLSHGANIRLKNDAGDSAIVIVMSKALHNPTDDSIAILESLLSHVGKDLDEVMMQYPQIAAFKGDVEFLEKSMESVNERQIMEMMKFAVVGNQIDAMKVLLEHANVNMKDIYGTTIISFAAAKSHYEMAKFLIGQGADPSIEDPSQSGGDAFVISAMLYDQEMYEILSDNIMGAKGVSPLMMATYDFSAQYFNGLLNADSYMEELSSHLETHFNDEKSEKILSQILTEIHSSLGSDGQHAIIGAVNLYREDNSKLLEYLIYSYYESSDHFNEHFVKVTSSFLEQNKVDSIKRIEYLLNEKNADVNDVDSNGVSALVMAVESNNPKAVDLLIENDADVNILINGQMSLLSYSIVKGYGEVSNIIVENEKFDINKGEGGVTPLMFASFKNDLPILEKLLNHEDVQVNGQDSDKLTSAAHFAAKAGNKEAFEMLVKHGADVNLKNYQSITPMDVINELKLNDLEGYVEELGDNVVNHDHADESGDIQIEQDHSDGWDLVI